MKSTFILASAFLVLTLSSCIEDTELDYNPIDDPNFQFVGYNVEPTTYGPLFRDLRINFSLRLDALTQEQRSKITALRLYEDGVARITTTNIAQRHFIRKDRLAGTTLVWEIVLVSGDSETPRHEGFRHTYYVE